MKLWDIFENSAEGRLRSGWRIIIFILLAGTLLILSSMLISSLLPSSVARFLAPALGLTLATWLAGKLADQRNFAAFGMRLSQIWWIEFLLGTLLAAGVSALILGIAVFFGWYEFANFGWNRTLESPFWMSLIGYTAFMLSVGYYEELAFRGYLNLNLFEGFSRPGAQNSWIAGGSSIVLIAALFGAVHATNPNATWFGVANILLAGIMLGVPFLATGRLGWSVGMHFSWNFVQGGILGLPVSGMPFDEAVMRFEPVGADYVTGGAFGLEGGLLGTSAILLILAIWAIYAHKYNYLRQVHPAIQVQLLMFQKTSDDRPSTP